MSIRPVVAVTMGDVNGIGPEILTKALANSSLTTELHPIVFGSASVFDEARRFAPACPPPFVVQDIAAPAPEGTIAVYEAGMPTPPLRPGAAEAEAGRCAVEWFRAGVRAALDRRVQAVVTCPLAKVGIRRAGYGYIGHTEVISELTGVDEPRMSLFSDRLRIVHISAHCSLADSVAYVTRDRIAETIRIADAALHALGVAPGRIAVAGLNPHAGEDGMLGPEETREILPAIRICAEEGICCSGPYPPDTVFRRMMEGEFDLVVAMYHDQGHTPFKLVAMHEGVSVTLGIPIVRTSVDHGTAYDIAWQGRAREHSLCAAMRLAARFAQSPAFAHETGGARTA